ncbi:hypothetical protein [Mucilaginibacter sp.]|uniref:hypothetical protein n=1 Tax=Mucilaginibacter sp. TaxID=1882438 RepID=UPI003D137C02
MPKTTYYDATTQKLSKDLYEKIKKALDIYMLANTAHKNKIKMAKPETFFFLIDDIEKQNPGILVTPKWLIEIYAGRKTGHNCQKKPLDALCRILNIEEDNDDLFIDLINNFKSLCSSNEMAKDFSGKYKLFVGGRSQPSIYDIAYDIPLEIYENGVVKINHTYTKKIYWGLLLVRDINTLEIVSFDFTDKKISSIGSFLMFKINGYRKRQTYFPGVNFGFDSANLPVVYQALLSADHNMHRNHPIVIDYYSIVANNLRMECPTLADTEHLREKYFNYSSDSQ